MKQENDTERHAKMMTTTLRFFYFEYKLGSQGAFFTCISNLVVEYSEIRKGDDVLQEPRAIIIDDLLSSRSSNN